VDDAPRCRLCLEKLGVRYRAAYGFGRTERLRERARRVDRLQAMLEGGPMRFKPVPPNWGDRRLDRRNRLTWALQQARVATRLTLIAYQPQHNSELDEPLPLPRAYKPLAAAIMAIPNLKSLWRATTTEDIDIALDRAQSTIMEALQSNDPQTRLKAASLMLRSRQARERGWC
jgi:HEAT repeat protein